MFNAGDEAIHPNYGRVVVEQIEKEVIPDGIKTYMVVRVVNMNMKIMIPVDSIDEVGIRKLSSKPLIEETINILKDDEVTLPKGSWNGMYRLHMEKIVSGDIRQVAKVIKGLLNKNTGKSPSVEDIKLLSCAKRILVGEIMVSEQIGEDKATQLLNEYTHNSGLLL